VDVSVQEISRCEVCSNTVLEAVLDLGGHPMCDDLIEVGDARMCKEYPIEILLCPTCLTAHQKYQIPKAELFPASYHYRSRFTADVLSGMQELVTSCATQIGALAGKTVVDIGCNDGSLLGFFRDQGAKTIGVEPTDAYLDAQENGHDVYGTYFDSALAQTIRQAHGPADIITFTNVFAHIEDLCGLLDAVKSLMHDGTVLVVENHYLGAVLDRNQFDTFYHEHPRTYSFRSFEVIADTLGAQVLNVEFPARYGGNIRVFIGPEGALEAPAVGVDLTALRAREAGFGAGLVAMAEGITQWKANKTAEIAALVDVHGPMKAKAFPGRAAILVKLLELDARSVSYVYEKPGSLKVGHYVPGTRIEILSDDDLFTTLEDGAPILNLAWHISGEIQEYLRKAGCTGSIVDILHPSDFESDPAS